MQKDEFGEVSPKLGVFNLNRKISMSQSKRLYETYSEDRMESAVNCIKNDGVSIKRAVEMFAINRTTLMNHVKNYKCNAIGRPTVLNRDEEQLTVHALTKLADWGFGLDRFQLQICVQDYLKRIDIENPFKNCLPGKDWIAGFEKRWKDQAVELLKTYPRIERKPVLLRPQNIFNCDESGFQTDVGIQTILCRKGSRNPHKVVGSVTKSTYSVLVCCNAIGDYLPLYVNYKGLHLYSNWCQNGPEDAVYNCFPSGWIELSQFANWLENVFIKHTTKLEGPKLLIFDGHNSHLTIPLIEMACANNIEFFCLPAHISHALQPLDVGVFKSVKTAWSNVLKDYYRVTGCKNVDKITFPSLLKKLKETGCFSRASAIGGFESAENVDQGEAITPNTSNANTATNSDVANSASSSRLSCRLERVASSSSTSNFSTSQQKKKPETQKRNRVRRKFAESLTSAEVLRRMRLESNAKTSRKTKKNIPKRQKIVVKSSSDSDGSLQINDDSDLDVSEVEVEHDDSPNTSVEPVLQMDINKIIVDSWVLVKFVVSKNEVYYIGKVTEIVAEGREVMVTFLRRKEKCFVYPNVADEAIVLLKDVVKVLPEPTIRRGMHSFCTDFSSLNSGKALIIS
ncbi:hypothetical protein NQ314_020178 [Rhamnusium bicolor]|uniref:DDE-1 domain-containing protein n=1 Tax=Rhamnusium bicolor TaxID=1586634 RepID=A0AAV8WKY1_9CUCU|nr:hypothetical protein NQ314_020178 [Rhamnusium bicolor]